MFRFLGRDGELALRIRGAQWRRFGRCGAAGMFRWAQVDAGPQGCGVAAGWKAARRRLLEVWVELGGVVRLGRRLFAAAMRRGEPFEG